MEGSPTLLQARRQAEQ